jgi:hypothetical protein
MGFLHLVVSTIARASGNTVTFYLKAHAKGGLAALCTLQLFYYPGA